MNDQEIIRTFVTTGSEEAFRELVERYSRLVYSACFRILNDTTEAEDASQIVFTILAKKAASLKREVILSGWLYQTAVYEARRMKSKLDRHVPLENEETQMMTDTERDDSNQYWNEIRPVLDDAISQLPHKLQEAVVLHFLEGKTQREVAGILSCGENAIQMRINRALEKLEGLLSRRGVTISAVALLTLLSTRSSEAASAGLNTTILKKAMGSVSKTAVSSSVGTLGGLFTNAISAKLLISTAAAALVIVSAVEFQTKLPTREKIIQDDSFPFQTSDFKATSPKQLSLEERFRQLLIEMDKDSKEEKKSYMHEIIQFAEEFGRSDPKLGFGLSKEIKSRDYRQRFFLPAMFRAAARHNFPSTKKLIDEIPEGNERDIGIQEIASTWAERDPKAAAEWLQSLPPSEGVSNGIYQVARWWGQKDPASAIRWAFSFPELDNSHTHAIFGALQGWASTNPEEAALWAEKLPKEYSNREWALKAIEDEWGKKDPERALQWAIRLPKDDTSKGIIINLCDSWVSKLDDPTKVIDWARHQPDEDTKTSALASIAYALVRLSSYEKGTDKRVLFANTSKKLLQELSGNQFSTHSAQKGLIDRVKSDQMNEDVRDRLRNEGVKSVLKWAESLCEKDKIGAYKILMEDWAKEDPDAAFNAIASNVTELRSAIYQYARGLLARNESIDVCRFAQQVNSLNIAENDKETMVDNFDVEISLEDPKILFAAKDIQDPAIAKIFWPNICERLTDKMPETVSKWISDLPTGEARDASIASFTSRVVASNPDDALRWIQSIQNEKIKTGAILSAASSLSFESSPAIADQWLTQLSNPLYRDYGLSGIITERAREHPEEAIKWAEKIQDLEIRNSAYREIATPFFKISKQGAEAWINQLKISPKDKAELLKMGSSSSK